MGCRNMQIQDVCTRICSGGTPKSSVSEYYEGGTIPWLNTREVNFRRIEKTENYITQLGLESSSAKWISKNAIVVAMYGATAGRSAITSIPLTTNQACCNLEIDPDKADYRYVYYWLMAHYEEIAGMANGGAQQNLNVKQIRELEIRIPDLFLQHQVANVLSAIDSKIELNNRTNDYLVALGQMLFNKFDNDENNPFVTVSDIAEVNPKRTIKKGDKVLCVEMANLSTSGPFPSDWCLKPYNGGAKFINGDTIVARITPCLENGKAGYVNYLNEGQTAFGSTEYIVLAAREVVPAEYLYFMVRSPEFVAYATARMSGSSGRQRVSASDIEQYEVRLPNESQLASFKYVASLAMQGILANSLENRQLAKLRDTLLSKLISGEIDVSKVEIESFTEQVGVTSGT